MMNDQTLYICPVCFAASERLDESHEHDKMILCEVGEPGDESRRPIKDDSGRYINRAPRWYNEAVGWTKRIPADKQ